jgi:hypothetical protein
MLSSGGGGGRMEAVRVEKDRILKKTCPSHNVKRDTLTTQPATNIIDRKVGGL